MSSIITQLRLQLDAAMAERDAATEEWEAVLATTVARILGGDNAKEHNSAQEAIATGLSVEVIHASAQARADPQVMAARAIMIARAARVQALIEELQREEDDIAHDVGADPHCWSDVDLGLDPSDDELTEEDS